MSRNPAGSSAGRDFCWPGTLGVAASSFSMAHRLPDAMRAVTFLPVYVSHTGDRGTYETTLTSHLAGWQPVRNPEHLLRYAR